MATAIDDNETARPQAASRRRLIASLLQTTMPTTVKMTIAGTTTTTNCTRGYERGDLNDPAGEKCLRETAANAPYARVRASRYQGPGDQAQLGRGG